MTRAQLVRADIPATAIDNRVKSGRLIAIYRGIHTVGHDALSDRGRIRAALLAVGPKGSASHTTAAYLDHLTPTLPAVLHVTSLAPAPRRRGDLVVHGTTRPFAPRTVGGFRATPTLRTLEDLGWPDKRVREAGARGLIRPQDVPSKVDATPTEPYIVAARPAAALALRDASTPVAP